MATKPIVVPITGDASGFDKTVNEVDGMFGRLGGSAEKMAGIIGGAFAVDKIVGVVGSLNSLGLELDVLDTKTSTVFEGAADSVRKWADANNEAMGMSDEKLAGLAAGFGDLLKPMGFTAEAVADMSTKTIGLSGVLSAWTGGQKNAAEVADILAKAMLGELDGLKALGISISAADVTARLAAKGQNELTGAALEQANALAIEELMFEKSSDAQKAWADGSMDAIKTQNTLKATIDDLKASLAEKLQPAFAAVASFAVGTMIPAFSNLAGAVKQLYENQIRPLINFFAANMEILIGVGIAIGVGLVGAVWAAVPAITAWAVAQWAAAAATIATYAPIAAIGLAIGALVAGVIWAYQNWDFFRTAVDAVASALTDHVWPAIQLVASWLWDKLGPAIGFVIDYYQMLFKVAMVVVGVFIDHVLPVLQTVAGWLWDQLVPAVKAYIDMLQLLWEKAQPVFGAVRDAVGWVVDKVGLLITSFVDLATVIAEKIGPVKDALIAPFKAAFNAIANAWNSTVGSLSFKTPSVLGSPSISFDMPDIPTFAAGGMAGGMVTVGERGREDVLLPQGSRVIPNHARGASGGTINVYAQTNADPWTIGRDVAWAMKTAGR